MSVLVGRAKIGPHCGTLIPVPRATALIALVFLLPCLAAEPVAGGQATAAQHRFVDVPPVKTSILLGSVLLEPGRFERKEGGYVATYRVRVFPFFFYNERGDLRIELSEEQLALVGRGERVSFKGRAVNSEGEPRAVSGTATPSDPGGGALKISIAVSKRLKLSFETTYRFLNP
jgi:hypothetical protein